MNKPDKNFRMTKQTKRMVALTKNADRRYNFKSAMIQAELSAEDARRQAMRSKGSKSKDAE